MGGCVVVYQAFTNGLVPFSSLTVVSPPCPEKILVCSGRVGVGEKVMVGITVEVAVWLGVGVSLAVGGAIGAVSPAGGTTQPTSIHRTATATNPITVARAKAIFIPIHGTTIAPIGIPGASPQSTVCPP